MGHGHAHAPQGDDHGQQRRPDRAGGPHDAGEDEGHPERHAWGIGRHWVGANFFYYLRDPAGNFSEYYSDMDEILDDQLWEPGVFDMAEVIKPKDWGPPLPASLIAPEDLAELMAGSH